MALFSISALVSLSALWLHQPLWALKYLKLIIFFSQNIQGQVSQRKLRMEAQDFSVPHMVIIGGSSKNCA